MRNVLNGWSMSPIIKLRSGVPFTVTNGNVDANLDGVTNDRANLIGDPAIDNPTKAQWFNTAAFVQNKVVTGVATDGNSGRNMLYGPAYHSVDIGLSRSFTMAARTKLSFRARGHEYLRHREPWAAGRRRPRSGRHLGHVRRDSHRVPDAQVAASGCA